MLIKKILGISLVLSFFLTLAQPATYNWPFTNPANYSYDTDKIEVTGGYAQLKGVSGAPWWNSNWQYRKLITITNNNTTPGVITLNAVADSYVREQGTGNAGTNYGSEPIILLKDDNTANWDSHGMIRFDLSGITNCTSAQLRLCVSSQDGASGEVEVHRILQSWDEMTITCSNSIGGSGENIDNFRLSTATAGTAASAPSPGTWISFDVTNDVQSFLSGTSNYGWYLYFDDSWAGRVNFHSREASDPALRPQLVISCVPPLPVNYSVSFTMDTTGDQFLDNGNDLRIIYYNGVTNVELHRVNETPFNTTNTKIWFATQREIAPNGGTDNGYWVYYGNPSAGPPPSNPNQVYLFWDDFNEHAEGSEPDGWTDVSGNFNVQNYNGNPALRCASSNAGPNYCLADFTPPDSNYLVRIKVLSVTTGSNYRGIVAKYTNADSYYRFQLQYSYAWRLLKGGSELQYTDAGGYEANQWYDYTIAMYGTNVTTTVDGVQIHSVTDSSPLSGGQIGVFSSWELAYYDDVLVRYYVPTEPTVELSGVASDNPSIRPIAPLSFTNLVSFTETAEKNGGEIQYTLSNNNGNSWWYYNSGWVSSNNTYSQSSPASVINANLSSFPVGDGNFVFNAFLHSDGTQLVRLDNIQLVYNNQPPTVVDLTANPTSVFRGQSVTISSNATDDLDEESALTCQMQYQPPGGSWTDLPSPSYNTATGSWQSTFTIPLTQTTGSYNCRVRYTDTLGLQSAWFTVNNIGTIENNLPTISSSCDNFSVNESGGNFDLTSYESDVEDSGTDLDWSVQASSVNTALFNATISDLDEDILTITPVAGEYGSDDITLILTDSDGGTAQKTDVTVTVNDTQPPAVPVLQAPANGAYINDPTPTFSWNSVQEAANYTLQYSLTADFSSGVVTVQVTTTSYTPTADLSETVYYWHVLATDAADNSSNYSATWSFTVDLTAPAVPTLQSPANNSTISDATPTFTWSAVSDAVSYTLQYSTSPDFSSGTTTETLTTTSYTPVSDLENTTYYWHVLSTDQAGNNSAYSSAWTVTIDTVAPEVPQLQSPADGVAINDTTPELTWSSTAGDSGTYTLQYSTTPDFSSGVTTQSGLTVNSYTIPTALSETTYYWRVLATDSVGNSSSYSSAFSFLVDVTAPNLPDLISPSNGAVLNDNTPTFSWQDVSDSGSAITYILQYADNSGFANAITQANLTTTSYTVSDTSPLADGTWYWRVRAIDAAGNDSGNPTVPFSFEVNTGTVTAPTLLSPADGSYINDTTPTFSWSSTAGPGGTYTFQCATDVDFTAGLITQTGLTETTYTLAEDLLNNITYYWRVEAFNNAGTGSGYQTPFSFTIDTTPPAVPELIAPANGVVTNQNQPTFEWSNTAEGGSFTLQYDIADNFPNPVTVSGITATTWTPGGSLPDATYYWRVQAVDPAGNVSGYQATAYSFVIDTDAPQVPVLQQPANGSFINTSTPQFTWSDTLGGAGTYTLEYADNSTFTNSTVVANLTTNNYTPTIALTETTYYWRVQAIDEAGNSSGYQAVPFSFTVDVTPPDPPVLQQPENGATLFVVTPTFEWSATAGDNGRYTLQYTTDSSFQTVTTISDLTTNSYTVPDDQPLSGNTYYWRVKAIDRAGNESEYQTPFSFTIDLGSLVPVLISPANGAYINTNLPTFEWSATAGAGGHYTLQYSTSEDFSSGTIEQTNIITNTYTPVAALQDLVYWWRVKAITASGIESNWQDSPGQFTVDTVPPEIPVLISPANGVSTNDTTPLFTWSSTAGEGGEYTLQLATDSGFSQNVKTFSEITLTSFVLPDEEALFESTWYWRVRAADRAGNLSAYQFPPFSFVLSLTAPPTPTLLVPENGSYVNTARPTFTWSEVSSAEYYVLQYAGDVDFTAGVVTFSNLITTSYTLSDNDAPLLNNTTYYWRVQAFNAAGNGSEYPSPFSFTVDLDPPEVPVLEEPTNNSMTNNNRPTFEWTATAGEGGSYTLRYARSIDFTIGLEVFEGLTETSFQVPADKVLVDAVYYWQVKAIDRAGNESGYQDQPFTFTVDTVAPTVPELQFPTDNTATNDTTPDFMWTATTGDGGSYLLQIATVTDFLEIYREVVTTTNIYTIPNNEALPDDTYWWRVKAIDGAGNESPFQENPFKLIIDTITPAVPQLLSPSHQAVISTYQPVFEWTATAGEGGHYTLQYATSPSFDENLTTRDNLSSNTYPVPEEASLGNGRYYWRVKATDLAGNESAYQTEPYSFTIAETLQVEPTDVASEAPQGKLVPMIKLNLKTNLSTLSLEAIGVSKLGTVADEEIASVRVYKDNNLSGQFEETQDLLISPETVVFTGGKALVTLTEQQILTTANQSYFVVFFISPSATPDRTVGAKIEATDFKVPAPNLVSSENLPFETGLVEITAVTQTVVVTGESIAPLTVRQDQVNVGMEKIELKVGGYRVKWKAIRVNKTGTSELDTDVAKVKIYRDENASGSFEPGADILISSGEDAFSSGTVNIIIEEQEITTTALICFIVVDVGVTAVPGKTIGVQVAAITVEEPHNYELRNVESGFSLIEATEDEISVIPDNSITPAQITQGDEDVLFEIITLKTNAHTAIWEGIKIEKTGSCELDKITSVKVYEDVNQNKELDLAEDRKIGEGKYTESILTIIFPQPIELSEEPKNFLFTYSLDIRSVPGQTLGASWGSADYFVIRAPDKVKSDVFPFQSGLMTIKQYPSSVLVIPTPVAQPEAVVEQGKEIVLEKLEIKTDRGITPWTKIRIDRKGTCTDEDIEEVRIYRDVDNNGTLNKETDTFLKGKPFAGNYAVLSFDQPEEITEQVSRYFIEVKTQGFARPYSTVGIECVQPDYFTVAVPATVSSDNFPFASNLVTINPVPKEVEVRGESLVPQTVKQDEKNVPFMKIYLKCNEYTALWEEVKFRCLGRGQDIAVLKIYQDEGSGTFEVGVDQLLATKTEPFAQGEAVVKFPEEVVISTEEKAYFVIVDIDVNAQVGEHLGLECSTKDYFKVNDPNKVADRNFPLKTDLSQGKVMPTEDTLYVEPVDKGKAEVVQGEKDIYLAWLKVWADDHSVEWKKIKILHTGTSRAEIVETVKIYKDTHGDGKLNLEDVLNEEGEVIDPKDVLIGQARFVNGKTTIEFGKVQEIFPEVSSYLVTVDISLLSNTGETVGICILDESAFVISSSDKAELKNKPFRSTEAKITQYPCSVSVSCEDISPPEIKQGEGEIKVGYFKLQTDQGKVPLVSVKVNLVKSGTRQDDISQIKIYQGNELVGKGVFPESRLAKISLDPKPMLTTEPSEFYLVFDVNPEAEVGAIIQAEVIVDRTSEPDNPQNDLEVVPPAKVEEFQFKTKQMKILDKRVPDIKMVRVLEIKAEYYVTNRTKLSCQWEGEALNGIAENFYCLATSQQLILADQPDVRNWTSTGTEQKVVAEGLPLEEGKTYFFGIRIKSKDGFYSRLDKNCLSQKIVPDFSPPEFSKEVKILSNPDDPYNFVIQWKKAKDKTSGVAKYQIEERRNTSLKWVLVAEPGPGQTRQSFDRKTKGTYFYRIRAVDKTGHCSQWVEVETSKQIGDLPEEVITCVSNFPNPFNSRGNGKTTITYQLNRDVDVEIKIYDVTGILVKTIYCRAGENGGRKGPGNQIEWDGRNERKEKVGKGTYLCIISAKCSGKGVVKERKIGVIH